MDVVDLQVDVGYVFLYDKDSKRGDLADIREGHQGFKLSHLNIIEDGSNKLRGVTLHKN